MNQQQTQSLRLLRTKAAVAHGNGDVGTVRHLCALALQGVSGLEVASCLLDDIAWAFVYGVNWLQHPHEVDSLLYRAYERVAPGQEAYRLLLKNLFALLRADHSESPSDLATTLRTFNASSLIAVSQELSEEVSLLVSLNLEALWCLESEESGLWEELGHKWEYQLADLPLLRERVEATVARLRVQHAILRVHGSTMLDLYLTRLPLATQLLAKAWKHYYSLEWDGMKQLLPDLVRTAPFTSDHFLAVQGLLNVSRMKRVQEPVRSGAGIYRYQRAQLSRPAAMIQSRRLAIFHELLTQVRREGKGAGYKRAEMYRLALVTEMAALRMWDLGSFLELQKRHRDFALDIGTYTWIRHGQPSDFPEALSDAVLSGVKSLTSTTVTKEGTQQAIHLLEISPQGREVLTRLASRLLEAAPIEWPYVVDALRVIGDSFPEDHLTDLSNWCKRVRAVPDKAAIRFDLAEFDFWVPILRHNQVPTVVWTDLANWLRDTASQWWSWNILRDLLVTFLSRAPEDLVVAVADAVLAGRANDRHDEERRKWILVNAALRNSVLHERVVEYLQRLGEVDPDAGFLQALVPSEKKLPCDHPEALSLVRHFRDWCAAISTQAPISIRRTWHAFDNVYWASPAQSDVDTILRDVEQVFNVKVGEESATAVLRALIGIAQTAPREINAQLATIACRLIVYKPEKDQTIHSWQEGPFDRVSFGSDIKNYFEYLLVVLASLVYPAGDAETRRTLLDWALKRTLTLDATEMPHLVRLFLCEATEGDYKGEGLAGLLALAGRKDEGIAGEAIKVLGVVLSNSDSEPVRLALRSSSNLNGVFSHWLRVAAAAPEPEARFQVARLIGNNPNLEAVFTDLPQIRERLSQDPRARVRGAVLGNQEVEEGR